MAVKGEQNEVGMTVSRQEQAVYKKPVLESINEEKSSAIQKYRDFFIGKPGLLEMVKYELAVTLLAPMTGALGLALRKAFYPQLFRKVGQGVVWGKNISLRHPGRISIGDRVGIDDDCLLDAKGGQEEGIQVGNDVLIARSSIIQCKTGPIRLGDRVSIGSQCQLSSVSGIFLGNAVMVGGQCYIGGGRYHIEDRDTPIMDQGLFSKGPVVVDEDVWVGAGVTILDGVHIGKGCVIGSGAVIREDLPPYSVVTPYQKLVLLPRGEAS
jgi:acetyltransferase-like isoleucine patch superfamily enzyme